MSFLAVGNDGVILRLGGLVTSHAEPFARGIVRDITGRTKTLNGVARTQITGQDFDLVIAVGDDGEALIQTGNLEWRRRSTGTGRHLNAVAIAPGTRTAWAVGDEGTILKTTDGGRNWSIQSSHTTRHLHAVIAVDKNGAWAAGDEGEIRKTGDAGVTWSRADTPGAKHLRGICRSSEVVVAVGDDGALVFRHAGAWAKAEITGKHLRAAAIAPSGLIIAVGDDGWIGTRKPVGFAGDQASHWKRRTDVTSRHLRGVIARDNNHWAIVGDGEFLTSDDGGTGWQRRKGFTTRLNAVC
jgi:photosystem II stability/assembly factor-like uncharacterized protein